MNISEVIQEDVVAVDIDDSLLNVAGVLHEEQVGSAVVLNPKGEIAGVVTDLDLVVYGHRYADSLEGTVVNEILSMPAVSVTPGVSIDVLTETMREEGVRRVPTRRLTARCNPTAARTRRRSRSPRVRRHPHIQRVADVTGHQECDKHGVW